VEHDGWEVSPSVGYAYTSGGKSHHVAESGRCTEYSWFGNQIFICIIFSRALIRTCFPLADS
jgi:hypothetical protein